MAELRLELRGGLANQLFEWAAAEQLATEFGIRYEVDARMVSRPRGRQNQLLRLGLIEESRTTSVPARAAWGLVRRLLPGRISSRLNRALRPRHPGLRSAASVVAARSMLDDDRGVVLQGVFADAEYLDAQREVIRPLLMTRLSEWAGGLTPGGYAAMHVRRGDYVSQPAIAQSFGVCSPAYYREGLGHLVQPAKVIVVSDDMEWCRAEFAGVDGVEFSDSVDHFSDLLTLACADKGLILSNSTFSWWGAYLSDSLRIIAPSPWQNDPARDHGISRHDWILLDKATGAVVPADAS